MHRKIRSQNCLSVLCVREWLLTYWAIMNNIREWAYGHATQRRLDPAAGRSILKERCFQSYQRTFPGLHECYLDKVVRSVWQVSCRKYTMETKQREALTYIEWRVMFVYLWSHCEKWRSTKSIEILRVCLGLILERVCHFNIIPWEIRFPN